MNNLYLLAIGAGIVFGAWPLLLNKSGLSGYTSATMFTIVVLAVVLPIALYDGMTSVYTANWRYYVAAGILGGIGLLIFNTMLSKASVEEVGSLFITTLLVQVMVPAIYQGVVTQTFPLRRFVALVFASLAIYLIR